MSKVNTAKILSTLDNKWNGNKCKMCGTGEMNVNDTVFELREYNNGDIVLGGKQQVFPIVPVACNNCGYTVLVSPIIIKAI